MPRSWLLLVSTLAVMACGCQRETTPPLIEVRDVTPREVEQGDSLVVSGVGFPEGKVAHVAFRGDLHRSGEAAVRGVDVAMDALVAASTEIDIPFTEALQAEFAGPGERASHTTFVGEVTVAFSSLTPGAPPVAGTLRDAWLDVRPPVSERVADPSQGVEGERTLRFLGIRPAAVPPTSGGILIEAIDHGSPADVARFLPGDVLTEMDGLRVLSVRDVVPAEGARSAALKIRRDGSPHEESAQVSLLGLRPRSAIVLRFPLMVLGLTTLLLALMLAPATSAATWAARRLAGRVRHRAPFAVPSVGVAATAVFTASITFAAMALSHPVLGADLDVGLLFLLSVTARLSVALLTGGDGRPGAPKRYSVVGAAASVMHTCLREVPGAAGILCAIMMTGSLRLDDIVRAQAAVPWGWTLFRTPAAALLFPLFLAPLMASPPPGRHRLFALAESANVLITSALAAALFLGGWRLPGFAPEQVDAHGGLELLGAALFAVKAWSVVGAVLLARWALPRVGIREMTALTLRWLLPLSLAGLGLAALWVRASPPSSTENLVGVVLFASFAVVGLHFAARVRYDMRASASEADLPLSPFL